MRVSDALLPCRHGKWPRVCHDISGGAWAVAAACKVCEQTDWCETRDEAIAAWNTRVMHSAPEGLVTAEMIEAGNGAFDAFMRRTGTPDENDLVVEIYLAMHSRQPPVEGLADAQIKHMVERFLGWKLPEDFHPDAGISFKPTFNDHLPTGSMLHNPTGTNLFDYTQAEAMVRHMIEGLPASVQPPVEGDEVERVARALNGPFYDVPRDSKFTLEELRERRWDMATPQMQGMLRQQAKAAIAAMPSAPSTGEVNSNEG